MSFKHTETKEGKNIILDISFNPSSTFYSTLLSDPNFTELTLRTDGIRIKIPEKDMPPKKDIGIRVDGNYQSLFSEPGYARPGTPAENIIKRYQALPEGILKSKVIEQPSFLQEEQAEAVGKNECPQCGSHKIYHDYGLISQGEEYCRDCGFVMNDRLANISREKEWRAFDDEQYKSRTRVGAEESWAVHDKGLSTVIDWQNRDINGKLISFKNIPQTNRMRKWQARTRVADATEKRMAYALVDMNNIANKLNLPKNVLEEASVIYRKAVKEKITRGRSIQGVAGGSIYLACRKHGLNKSLEEVSREIIMPGKDGKAVKKEIGGYVRTIINKLDYSVPYQRPDQYVSKFSNQLAMPGKIEEIAHKINAAAKEANLVAGRYPKSIAAAASYIASVITSERKTQREIAKESNLTEVTIRNRYKELVELLTISFSL